MGDPGSGVAEKEILEGIRRAGRTLKEIPYALLTHCHVDHALGAYRFREMGLRLVSSPAAAALLRTGSHRVWYEYPARVVPTEIDITPGDGETLGLGGMVIQMLHTPGHTVGGASYVVQTTEGLTAFTGDLYGRRGDLSWSGAEDFSAQATLESLEKLLSSAPDRVYTGHGLVEGRGVDWLRDAVARGKADQWTRRKEFHPDVYPVDRLPPTPARPNEPPGSKGSDRSWTTDSNTRPAGRGHGMG